MKEPLKTKVPSKDKWEYCDVIPLLLLLGVNHIQPVLNMSKIFVNINNT